MNEVNLNEYLLEGLGEIHSLIAHEVQVHFNSYSQRMAFLRRSNTKFLLQDKYLGQIEISYAYLIDEDVWRVLVNDSIHFIVNGRSKSVSEISHEIVNLIVV